MTTATRYKASKTSDGLLIKDVVLAVTGNVHSRGIELTEDLFDKFAAFHQNRLSRGYIGAYVLLGHDGPRVGKITKLSQSSGNLLADIIITNEDVASKVEKADLTDISITFSMDGILADVSLLDNTIGQLADKIPALLVDTKEEFGIEADSLVKFALPRIKEIKMALTPEDMEQIASLVNKIMDERMGDGGDKPTEDVEMAISQAADKKLAARMKQLEEKERELEIASYVAALSSKTGHNEVTLRRIFKDIKTEEGRKIKFESLMKQEDAKADIETQYSKPTIEKALRQEYQLKADSYKKLGITEDKYVRMNRERSWDLK